MSRQPIFDADGRQLMWLSTGVAEDGSQLRHWQMATITDEMIERGAAEVRGSLQQYYDGKIEAIQPGSLAEDVLRAALPRNHERTEDR